MNYSRLLDYLWRAGRLTGRVFDGVCGERVKIVSEGTADQAGVWLAADVEIDGERRRGTVVVGDDTRVPDEAVLRVVCGDARPVLGADDLLVPQIRYRIEPGIRERYDALRAGAHRFGCAGRIAGMADLHRTSLYTSLMIERLERKFGDVMRIFRDSAGDWNQTFYVMLLGVMGGGGSNKNVYTSVASKVTHAMLSREKGLPMKLEALLLGAAGFLFAPGGVKDDYTLRLEDEFRHLAAKYSIVPLKPAVWETSKLNIANYPTVRLVQIAALFARKDFVLDSMLACRRAGDVNELFGVEASEYWNTHYMPGAGYGLSPKKLGKVKTGIIGINLTAPLMFAYGRETGREELCERALDLLSDIPAERNSKINGWYDGGCVPENGFESQALLQLVNEYCAAERCAECRIGRGEIKKVL